MDSTAQGVTSRKERDMSNGHPWQFTVTDFRTDETWPYPGTRVGLRITDGDRVIYRSTVVAEGRTRGLSHNEVVRLAWDDVKADVAVAQVEGSTFVLDENGIPQPVVANPARFFEVDTTRDLERLVGELLNDSLVFDDGRGTKYPIRPSALRYYTNLLVREREYGSGTIDLISGSSIPMVQLVTDVRIRDRQGAEWQRHAAEIVRISVG
jgi:hypothetical protein